MTGAQSRSCMPLKLPKYVHQKRAKGRRYFYYDTGTKSAAGKPILSRLPDYASNGFGRALAACEEARERRAKGQGALMVKGFISKFTSSPAFRNKKPNTQASYLTYLKQIEDLMGEAEANDVTPADVAAVLEKLSANPGAANQCVRTLSALYYWGKRPENNHVKSNPASNIELFDGGEHEPWNDATLEAGLEAKDPQTRLAIRLLYYTAQRIGDVCRMRWSDIQPDGTLYVKPEKTDRRNEELWIPIHSELGATLSGMKRSLTTIICRPDGKPYSDETVRKWIKDFGKERGVELVPHGLRKNAVNALLEAGCSAAETASISGQSLQMVEHYAKKRNRRKLGRAAMKRWDIKAT